VLRLYDQIRDAPVPFPAAPPLGAPLRALLAGLLEKDPERRLGLAQVGGRLGGRLGGVRRRCLHACAIAAAVRCSIEAATAQRRRPLPFARQVACHEWVTDGGRLPPLPLCAPSGTAPAPLASQEAQHGGSGDRGDGGGGGGGSGGGGGGGGGGASGMGLTAWVHQVKQVVPSIEERVFRRGAVLVR
jgi:uncharacterized membrane protein YgcG